MNPKSLNDILEKGSASFRRINAITASQVYAVPETESPAHRPLASLVSVPKPKRDRGQALGRIVEAETGSTSAIARRPCVHISLFRVKLLDRDNKWGAVKYLLDALSKSQLIEDDSEQDIDLRVTQHRVDSFNKEGTGVAITYKDSS